MKYDTMKELFGKGQSNEKSLGIKGYKIKKLT